MYAHKTTRVSLKKGGILRGRSMLTAGGDLIICMKAVQILRLINIDIANESLALSLSSLFFLFLYYFFSAIFAFILIFFTPTRLLNNKFGV